MSDHDKGSQPIDSKNLPTQIKRWLGNHGYPLEMRVARAFREGGCSRVVQSEFYESRDVENKVVWREIDVTAQMGVILHRVVAEVDTQGERSTPNNTTLDMFFDFFFVAECKSNATGKRPWLVFTNHTSEPDFDQVQRQVESHPMTELAQEFASHLHLEDAFDQLDFFGPRRLGYSAVQPFVGNDGNDNHDGAYKAITSVLGAALAKTKIDSQFQVFRFVVPLVVITAPLFECYLDVAGEVALEQREEMAVHWRNPSVGLGDSIVYIVTETQLPAFLQRARRAFEALSQKEPELIAAAMDEKKNSIDLGS